MEHDDHCSRHKRWAIILELEGGAGFTFIADLDGSRLEPDARARTWSVGRAADGRTYYYHEATGEARWALPPRAMLEGETEGTVQRILVAGHTPADRLVHESAPLPWSAFARRHDCPMSDVGIDQDLSWWTRAGKMVQPSDLSVQWWHEGEQEAKNHVGPNIRARVIDGRHALAPRRHSAPLTRGRLPISAPLAPI